MITLEHGSKIGNATVIVDIIQKGNPEVRPGNKMVPKYTTDHDTGNPGRNANAEMHNRLIHNLSSYHPKDTSHVSWHLSVDEHFIIQHIPFDENAWHCGDGTGPGNMSSIGVEKCMHAGCDREAIEYNAIALHAYLMHAFKLPIDHVRPHQAWSGKYCPQLILNKYGSFKPFRDKIEAAYKSGVKTAAADKLKIVKEVDLVKGIGTAQVKVDGLSLRDQPNVKGKLIRKLDKGSAFTVYAEKDGWLALGGGAWASNVDGKYMDYEKHSNYEMELAAAVKWAQEEKVSDGTKLGEPITRAQAILMHYRASQK
ncbi:N-acetylmuramoyl-L-alanine amidase [Jeotgalibacillus terrae]|uniref:N-acetylmuramoyl-L-alanine amidase n=1 Tax=Jeotgalibacillus terrae TaxID=587735 RepID=A0ABW5ZNJ9_9BACL|nr:N-acetylmuramoyl-L-alanine amidase [Jeotgalibacillus terrae]MBM7577652.1 hypothetical protein [Jeotgalibacillus terrae]